GQGALPSRRVRPPSEPLPFAPPKIGVGLNSVIVRDRAARYKLAPRAGVRFAHGVAMSSQKNGAAILDKTKAYRPSDKEPFMNEREREYFGRKLLTGKEETLKEAKEPRPPPRAENENHPALAARAPWEPAGATERRARARQRKLIAKIDAALARLEDG